MAHMQQALSGLREGETVQDFVARSSDIVKESIATINAATAHMDAFDMIEFLRLRETPITLDGYRESLADQRPAIVELVALVLLSRGTRAPSIPEAPLDEKMPRIPELHSVGTSLLSLGQFSLMSDGDSNKYGPLTSLAALYVGHEINVNYKQYGHLQDHFNEALFAGSQMSGVLARGIGFDYSDFAKVRDAIHAMHLHSFLNIRNAIGDIIAAHNARAGSVPSINGDATTGYIGLLEHPGTSAQFTARGVSTYSSVPEAKVVKILDLFSVDFDEPFDAESAVTDFLQGDSLLRDAALVTDGVGHYITMNKPIGTDSLRRVIEAQLKAQAPLWRSYEKHRSDVSESLAVHYLSILLQKDATYTNLKYHRPNDTHRLDSLGKNAQGITSFSEQAEADALFIVEDVAICLEVKGRSVSGQARGGHVQRLTADLKATIGDATQQALRLENLIRENHGLWQDSTTWIDLSQVREVRSIAVCLDDMGPLATGLDELVRSRVISSDRFPWIVSLHDLAVISEVIDTPAELLLYLRRRTDSDVSRAFWAIDELDLFMLFMAGHLYTHPDPDLVRDNYLGVPEPTNHARKLYREERAPTRIMTQTDPLDAWMYYKEGATQSRVPKPTFRRKPAVGLIVDFLRRDCKPGWFRFSADLLNLGEDGQDLLGRRINEIAKMTRRDQRWHSLFLPMPGTWGYPALFVGTKPDQMPELQAWQKLAAYATAKQKQIGSDRSLMLMIDSKGTPLSAAYGNQADGKGRGDAEVQHGITLTPIGEMGRTKPPSAARSTRRLKQKGRKRS
ncbi:hypothetical protein [Clavibacter michiganensis]|uniref:hypothetical protein n=1 Tax=Clavibacter michiganensis TaxID=28447 RepID=UPI001BE0FEC3|nr:hypothetical protein [Clavibacter michiganensis]MBT1635436.1 hypothetical protein [Clavibacter michiganensis]